MEYIACFAFRSDPWWPGHRLSTSFFFNPLSALEFQSVLFPDRLHVATWGIEMDGSRFRYVQSQDIEGLQHETPWSDSRLAKSRVGASIEDEKGAYSPYRELVSSTSGTRQNGSWMGTLVVIARNSFRSVENVTAKPTLLAVLTHGIVLALFWIPTATLYTCKQTHDPATWFAVLWAVVSCAELLFSVSVVRALCRHLASGRRVGMTGPFLLTLYVRLFFFPFLFPRQSCMECMLTSRRAVPALVRRAGSRALGVLLLVDRVTSRTSHVRGTIPQRSYLEQLSG